MRLHVLPLVACSSFALAAAEADLPTWPDPKTFTPGQETKFRLPGFAPYLAYPDKDPYYNVLMVPANFDPKRSYPLGIEFQPQGSKPSSWFLAHANENQSFVLGVSWMIPAANKDRKEGDETKGPDDVHIGPILHVATVQWVLQHFPIDRSRVYVGGMSAGGWAASSEGMSGFFKNLSTHFVILNSGNRGRYNPAWFAGQFAFVASGTADFNNAASHQAVDELTKAKLEVTHFEEPGIGHDVGPITYIKLAEWYTRFDPAAHAEEWLNAANTALSDKTVKDPTVALAQLAEVATLGENHPQGKLAREALLAREADALLTYELGYEALRQRRYAEAQKQFLAAQKSATKLRSPRIMTLATRRIPEIQEWMFCEEAVALQAAHAAGRDLEAAALAQDCLTRWKTDPPDWPVPMATWAKVTMAAAQTQKPDAKHRQAQLDLAKWRLELMTGKADAGAGNKKGRETLEAIVAGLADSGEALEAAELLERWPVVEAKK